MSTKRNTETYAIAKLRVYSADDSIDRERLATLLAAYDSGDSSLFISECVKVLPSYRGCDIFIDDLYVQALDAHPA